MSPDPFSQLLVGAGVIGVVAAIALASVFGFIVPIWALIDVLQRKDMESNTRLGLAGVLFFTWGVGSFFYGLIFADNRFLRWTIIVGGLLTGCTGVLGMGSCIEGTMIQQEKTEEQRQVLSVEVEAAFEGLPSAPMAGTVPALSIAMEGSYLRARGAGDFGPDGVDRATLAPVDDGLRHLATSEGVRVGLTDHDVVSVAEDGAVTKLEEPDDPGFSFLRGLAVAPDGAFVVATAHITTRLYRLLPDTLTWEPMAARSQGLPLVALAILDDGMMVALEEAEDHVAFRSVTLLSPQGAIVERLALSPAVPTRGVTAGFQLVARGSEVFLVMPEASGERAGVYRIDPATGDVSRPVAP